MHKSLGGQRAGTFEVKELQRLILHQRARDRRRARHGFRSRYLIQKQYGQALIKIAAPHGAMSTRTQRSAQACQRTSELDAL